MLEDPSKIFFYHSEGALEILAEAHKRAYSYEESWLAGHASCITTLLDFYNIGISAEERNKVRFCRDLPQLDIWLRRLFSLIEARKRLLEY